MMPSQDEGTRWASPRRWRIGRGIVVGIFFGANVAFLKMGGDAFIDS